MIYVDLGRLEIPDELRQELEQATQELLTLQSDDERKPYIDKKSHLWGEVRPFLARVSGLNENDCKCWYCESKGPGFTHHVDHFRPKMRVKNAGGQEEPGYWWLAFNAGNYRLSCQRCNTGAGKRDQFPLAEGCQRACDPLANLEDEIPLLLDPALASDPMLLTYSEDGRVYPRYSEDSFPGTRAETSIRVYDLNHVSKVEARKSVWLDCSELAKRAKRALDQLVASPPEARLVAKERFEDVCRDIKKRVSVSAEYSAMAHYCFRGMSRAMDEEWLSDLL
jgi:uncharacterized protein (TIGR02646 family)